MKKIDLETFLFRINVVIIACVFVLVVPTTQIIASWNPGKKDILWLFPLLVAGTCALLWFLTRVSIPVFIRWGAFKDRRGASRPKDPSQLIRSLRMIFPILTFLVQMLFLVLMATVLIEYMREHSEGHIFKNIP